MTTPTPPLVLVDAYAISTALGIPTGTIRRWAHEGKVARHGSAVAGRRRTLYDLREVEDVARRLGHPKA